MKILFMLLVLSGAAMAQDYKLDKNGQAIPSYLGKIRIFKGEVLHFNKGKRKQVKLNTQIYKEDTLTTGEKSFAKIIMVDETIITLGPKSELKFDTYEFTDKTERRIHSYVRGQLSAHVKNKAKEGDIVFKTPNAILGVRGTHLAINHRTLQGQEISEFALLSGSAEVSDSLKQKFPLAASDKIIIVHNPATNKQAHEAVRLSAEEFDFLTAVDKEDEDVLLPLMPYFDPMTLGDKSALKGILGTQATLGEPIVKTLDKAPAAPTQQPGGSFENLKKLNEQLKKTTR